VRWWRITRATFSCLPLTLDLVNVTLLLLLLDAQRERCRPMHCVRSAAETHVVLVVALHGAGGRVVT
jgi:hypothetical protein